MLETVAIIGGGPSGLAAAYYAQKAGFNVVLFEKNEFAGGKGASRKRGDYIVDFGPHAFHPSTKEMYELMQSHVDGQLFDVQIFQQLYITTKIMNYPFRIRAAILGLNPITNFRILSDYIYIRLKSIFVHVPRGTFKQWGMANFGKTLYNLCFGDYSEKVWRCSADTISVEFARRKLPNYSLAEMLWERLTKKKTNKTTYHSGGKFLYHKEGIGKAYQNIANGIVERGGQVIYNSKIERILLSEDGSSVKGVQLQSSNTNSIHCDHLISTIPINDLISLLSVKSEKLHQLESAMEYRHMLIINVILKKTQFTPAHWIYLVNNCFNFNRVSEQKNLSDTCAPADKTLVAFERLCKPEDEEWHWEPSKWREMVLQDLSPFGIEEAQIEEIFVDRIDKSYTFFYVGYEKKKAECLAELSKITNLVSTGRNGLSLDIDMHDSMIIGKQAFLHVSENKVADFYQNHEALCNQRDH